MKGTLSLMVLAAMLTACASTSQDLAREIDASRAAGRPLLIYALGVEHTDAYIRSHTTAGLGLVNTGKQAITGLRVTFIPYQLVGHSPAIAKEAMEIDLTPAIPAGGIPPDMGIVPSWDNGSSLVDCLHIDRVDVVFADGGAQSIAGKDLEPYLAPYINRNCVDGEPSPDYKAIGLNPVPMYRHP